MISILVRVEWWNVWTKIWIMLEYMSHYNALKNMWVNNANQELKILQTITFRYEKLVENSLIKNTKVPLGDGILVNKSRISSYLSHKLEGYVVPTVLYTAHSSDCYQYIVPKCTFNPWFALFIFNLYVVQYGQCH